MYKCAEGLMDQFHLVIKNLNTLLYYSIDIPTTKSVYFKVGKLSLYIQDLMNPIDFLTIAVRTVPKLN